MRPTKCMAEKKQEEDVTDIKWWGLTDIGRFRKSNEDAFLALALDGFQVKHLGKVGESQLNEHDYIFAVSDGMGGAKAGEFASRIAVEKITYLFPHKREKQPQEDCLDLLKELFTQIHEEIMKISNSYEECKGMGATLSLCRIRAGRIDFCHIGDSRIYQIRDGEIRQLTQDHTHVGWLYQQGKLNEREARNHPGRNALQQVLGGKTQFLQHDTGSIKHEPGDTYLLCTDGVIEGLWDRGLMRQIISPLPNDERNPAERIVLEAVAEDGRDNATAVVLQIG